MTRTGDRCPPIATARFENYLGGVVERWLGIPATEMFTGAGDLLLPIHWGTFDLSTHRWDQPIETAWTHAAESGVQLLTPRLGEAVEPVLAFGKK